MRLHGFGEILVVVRDSLVDELAIEGMAQFMTVQASPVLKRQHCCDLLEQRATCNKVVVDCEWIFCKLVC